MALIAMAIAAAARQKHEGICSRLAPSLRGGELECPAGAKAAEGQGHHRSCPASGGGRDGAPGGRSSSEEQHGCRREAKSKWEAKFMRHRVPDDGRTFASFFSTCCSSHHVRSYVLGILFIRYGRIV